MEPLTIVTDDYLDDHAEQMAAHEEMQRELERCGEFADECQRLARFLNAANIHFTNLRLEEGKETVELVGLEVGTLIQAVKTHWRSGS